MTQVTTDTIAVAAAAVYKVSGRDERLNVCMTSTV